eukprot:g53425.t1
MVHTGIQHSPIAYRISNSKNRAVAGFAMGACAGKGGKKEEEQPLTKSSDVEKGNISHLPKASKANASISNESRASDLPALNTASSSRQMQGSVSSLGPSNSTETLTGSNNGSTRQLGSTGGTKRNSRIERRRKKDEEMGPMSLEDALKLGPPPMQEQVHEVLDLLEELMEDLTSGQLQRKKVRSRLNEASYILNHLKIPEEALENRAERLAKQIATSTNMSTAVDTEVQLWMKRSFGAHTEVKNTKHATHKGLEMKAAVVNALTIGHLGKAGDSDGMKRQRLKDRLQRVLLIDAQRKNKKKVGEEGLSAEEYNSMVASLSPLHRIQMELAGFTPRLVLRGVAFWSFDIFRLSVVTHHRPLSCIMFHIFTQLDLFSACNLQMSTLANWLIKVEEAYKENPYHNRIHAADVVQNLFYLLTGSPIKDQLDKVQWFAALIAAAIHDVEHPGLTNLFLTATRHPLAIRYNDQSILENMHCARAFQIMRLEGCDIMAGLPISDKRRARKQIVEMVLHTDMKHHFGMLASIQSKIAAEKAIVDATKKGTELPPPRDSTKPQQKKTQMFANSNSEDMLLLLKVILHVADLGNPAKPETIMTIWTARITEEFFRQGDAERKLGMPISAMMDRTKPNIPNSQVGFIDVIVAPLFKTYAGCAPTSMEAPLELLNANKKFWQEMLKAPSALRLPGVDSLHAGRVLKKQGLSHQASLVGANRFADDDED